MSLMKVTLQLQATKLSKCRLSIAWVRGIATQNHLLPTMVGTSATFLPASFCFRLKLRISSLLTNTGSVAAMLMCRQLCAGWLNKLLGNT